METRHTKISPTKTPKSSIETQCTIADTIDAYRQNTVNKNEKESDVNSLQKSSNTEQNGQMVVASPTKSVMSTAWQNEKDPKTSSVDSQCIVEGDSKVTIINEIKVLKKNHIKEKIIFVISVVSLVVMSYGVVYVHWLLPYYYAISAPLMMIMRFILYFKNKWLNFMLDFCYFANTLCYIYIWAIPNQSEVFMVLFAFSNGPLPWATIIFRNSLVFHSPDKMTSVYIHVLPMFLTFSIRWFSSSISQHWFTPFMNSFSEDIGYMFIWLVGVPLSLFIAHTMTLFILVQIVCRPKEKYIDSYRFLSNADSNWTGKILNCLGPKHKGCMFNSMTILYGIASHMLLPLWYKYFIAHCIYIVLVLLVIIWNGAGYYIDVFGPREIQL